MTGLPDAQSTPDVQAAFAPLAELPCWNVHVGYGGSLVMDFGEPRLKISPERPNNKSRRPRFIHLYGQWHLWLWCCDWFVVQDGRRQGGSLTKSRQEKAVQRLAHRKLLNVAVNTIPGRSVFTFEGGVHLSTRPYNRHYYHRSDREQWLFFEPSDMVLSLYESGAVTHKHKKAKPE